MQSGHYRHDNQGQAGLEVVPQHGQPWLEVRQDHYDESKELAIPKYPDTYHGAQASPQSAHQYPYPHPYPDTPVVIPNAPAGSDPNAQADRKRRRRIIIGVVLVIVVVIIAAVLGGVLGSRASRSGADSSSGSAGSSEGQNGSGSGSNSGSSNSTSPSRPKTVRQGTALTIGGWRKPTGDVELWLFYQDPEGGLRYSRCNSTSRLVEGQKSCWGPPTSFFSNAKAPAQLGVGFLVFSARHSPQVELFYSGPSNRLLGTNFNDLSTPSVAEDSVNMVGITTGTNSSLSSYWPWTIFQDPAGGIIHVRNDVVGPQKSPASVWSVSATNITAAAGSKFALVPMSTNFSAIAEKAGYAVFYQTLDGKLGVNIPDLNSPQRDANYSQSWPTGTYQPSTLPAKKEVLIHIFPRNPLHNPPPPRSHCRLFRRPPRRHAPTSRHVCVIPRFFV